MTLTFGLRPSTLQPHKLFAFHPPTRFGGLAWTQSIEGAAFLERAAVIGTGKSPFRHHTAHMPPGSFPHSQQAAKEQLAIGRSAVPEKLEVQNEPMPILPQQHTGLPNSTSPPALPRAITRTAGSYRLKSLAALATGRAPIIGSCACFWALRQHVQNPVDASQNRLGLRSGPTPSAPTAGPIGPDATAHGRAAIWGAADLYPGRGWMLVRSRFCRGTGQVPGGSFELGALSAAISKAPGCSDAAPRNALVSRNWRRVRS